MAGVSNFKVGFGAKIEKFAETTKARTLWVYQNAMIDMGDDAQKERGTGGRMPVDTGFLRASLRVIVRGAPNAKGRFAHWTAIPWARLGDKVVFRWEAPYAGFQEFGWRHQAGRFFARGAAQRWKQFVDARARMAAWMQW